MVHAVSRYECDNGKHGTGVAHAGEDWMRNVKQVVVVCVALTVGSAVQAQVFLLNEGFETGTPPAGWSTSNNTPSAGWEFGYYLGSEFFPIPPHGRYAASNDDAYDDSSTTANLADQDYLISPPVDFTVGAVDGIVLSFSYVQPNLYGSVGTVELRLSGGTWIPVATVPPATDWTKMEIDLSVFSPNHVVEIAFHHNDQGNWADGFAVDDVAVVTRVADGVMDQVLTAGYLPAGFVDLEGTISNQGGATINSVDVAYQINGGAIETATIAGLDLGFRDSSDFVHPVPAQLLAVDVYQIEMWITGVNGSPDANTANNLASSEVITLSEVPPKKVILSNHTGTWCSFCPDGYVRLEEALALYGNLIGLSIHSGDVMAIPDGEALDFYFIGYPSGMIDIYKFPGEPTIGVSRDFWNMRVGQRLGQNVPAYVSLVDVGYEPASRTVSATVQAEFFGPAVADFRVNLWVVEDGVTGSGSGYDQWNYYDTDPTHPYYGAGNPIIGFVHDRTLRAMIGGTWGTAGIIPPTVEDGDVYTHGYSIVLPAEYDETRIKLIGLVSRYDVANPENRAILNAAEQSLWGIFDDGFEWGDTRGWSSTSP